MFFYAEPDNSSQSQIYNSTSSASLVLTPSVNSIDFGNKAINTLNSSQFNISIAGTGSETLNVTSNSSNFYVVDGENLSINGGSNLRLVSVFAPTTPGVKTGILTISSSGGDIDTITVQGVGIDQYYDNTVILLKGDGASGSTNIVDSSINNMTVNLSGNTSISNISKYGSGSIYFDGNNDYLTVSSSNDFNFGTGDFTIETWIKPTFTTQTRGLFGKRANNTLYRWLLSFMMYNSSTNKYMLYYYVSMNGTSWAIQWNSGYTISPDVWTHLAFVRKGDNHFVYINGVANLVGTLSGTPFFDNAPLSIGSNTQAAPGNAAFMGYIDDFRITKGVARYQDAMPYQELPDTAAADSSYSNVSVLLHGNGSSYVDSGPNSLQINPSVGASLDSYAGKFGGAMGFNGSSGYLSLGTQAASPLFNLGTGNFTIEGWINPNSIANGRTIYGNYGRTLANGYRTGAHLLRLNYSNKVEFYMYGIPSIISNSNIPVGSWTHIALTRNGTTFKMFINGTLDTTYTSTINLTPDPTHPPTVGCFWQTNTTIEPSSWFDGLIDDFRITKGVVRYTENFTPPDSL